MGEDDHALVDALRRRDPAGLEGVYRRYADRLYTYARVLLRDSDGAADAVHDTFLAANSRIGQLRDPAQLRSWLYAIVRNECLRQLKVRRRGVPLDAVDEPVADLPEPERAVDAGQVRELVHAAAAGLNPSDREVLDLAIRHDLSAPEVAAAMGLAPNHVHARISRARTQLERALGALVVARGGTTDCAPLAALVEGWDGTLTPLLRKRISRHIDSCAVCARRRRDRVSPAALLAAYVPAFLVIGGDVWPKLVRTSSASTRTAAAARGRRRRLAAGVAAGTALVVLVGSGLLTLGSGDTGRNRRAAAPDRIAGSIAGAVPSTAPVAPSAAGRSGPPVTDPLTPTSVRPTVAAPAPAGTTPPAPTAPTASATPAAPAGAGALAVPFTVTATAATRCDGPAYTVTFTATATAALATAAVRSGDLPGGGRPMVVEGASAVAAVSSLTARSLSWTVFATAADGRTAWHAGAPVTNPCAPVVPG